MGRVFTSSLRCLPRPSPPLTPTLLWVPLLGSSPSPEVPPFPHGTASARPQATVHERPETRHAGLTLRSTPQSSRLAFGSSVKEGVFLHRSKGCVDAPSRPLPARGPSPLSSYLRGPVFLRSRRSRTPEFPHQSSRHTHCGLGSPGVQSPSWSRSPGYHIPVETVPLVSPDLKGSPQLLFLPSCPTSPV